MNKTTLIDKIMPDYSNDICYFLLPYGLGDSLILASLKEKIETFYNFKIHFLIKHTHKIIMDMYNIDSYTVINIPNKKVLDKFKDANKIQKGEIFIAHPLFTKNTSFINDFNAGKLSFYDMYLKMLNLPADTKFNSNIFNKLNINKTLQVKLEKYEIKNLSNVVLIAPEADSCPVLPNTYWENIIKKYKSLGYDIISNVKNKKNLIRGTKYIPLTILEAILIAQNCAGVISLRSGFCDLVALKHKGFLKVLYPNIDILNLYSLKRSFGYKNIEEQIVNLYMYKMYIYIFGIKIFKFYKLKTFQSFKLKFLGHTILND